MADTNTVMTGIPIHVDILSSVQHTTRGFMGRFEIHLHKGDLPSHLPDLQPSFAPTIKIGNQH